MRVQKRKKEKYDISKIRLVRPERQMTLVEALKFASKNSSSMAFLIKRWLDENKDDDSYVLIIETDGITSHVFCKTDKNDPFPVILYKQNHELSGSYSSTRGQILSLAKSLTPNTTNENQELKAVTKRFLQKDRMDSLLAGARQYDKIRKEENKLIREKRK